MNDITSNNNSPLKITLIGGSGLIGRKLAPLLEAQGHEVVIASPSRGVNSLTGEGLAGAVKGSHVVIDVTNSPSFEENAVREFFETSTRNLLAASGEAGVQHYIALSVVGTDRLPANGYFRAKLVQESLIQASHLPFTIVRATQFFEFIGAIPTPSEDGKSVRITSARFQPMAADDVAAALAEVATSTPQRGIVEIAGPESAPMDEIARRYFQARGDSREVIGDAGVTYFGAPIDDRSLTPGAGAKLGKTWLVDWLKQQA
ncbi:SDR family oxidoreductase [Luteolibacter flavescens]|uniref:SDR family oxidoreductase n=1 Tax=Luteolibacter flavescens TaxID=1859460 RepID=A0ABT3FSH7_9BACT|nr:SDR family oxidoreductase [Luteolibacter flavescens]MCW1886541.1 SDR family oxidoreductase [Luteolibacter flavescens]